MLRLFAFTAVLISITTNVSFSVNQTALSANQVQMLADYTPPDYPPPTTGGRNGTGTRLKLALSKLDHRGSGRRQRLI